MEKCFACSRANPKHVCAGCTQALYCGAECAQGDWKNHLRDCKPIENSMSYMFLLSMKSRLSAWRMIYKAYGNDINRLVLDLNDFDMDEVKFYDALHNEIVTDRKQDREKMAYDVDEDRFESVSLHKKSFEQYRRQLTKKEREMDDLLTPDDQRRGIVQLLRFLLEDGEGSLFVQNNYGITVNEFISNLFYAACRLGALEVIKMLVEAGFRRQTQFNLGLIEAGSNYEVAKYLLNNLQADPTFNNYRALDNALIRDDKDIVLLIFNDPRVNQDIWGDKIFRWACLNNYVDVVQYLLQYTNINPADNRNCAIRIASELGQIEIVRLLLQDKRVDPSEIDNYAIRWAAENGHAEVIRLLLQDKRVNPSDNKNQAIQDASNNGHTEIVRLLLQDKRVDPSDKNNKAIRYASQTGHIEVVRLLLQDPRVDPSDGNNYAIIEACKNQHADVVRLLLQDERVDASASHNFALNWALIHNYIEIVRLLLEDEKVRNKLGELDTAGLNRLRDWKKHHKINSRRTGY